jgi:hypothetical protein
MAPTLSLRFIRKVSNRDATTDDVVLIRKEGVRFSLTFRYSNSEGAEVPQTGTLVAADLKKYVSNILHFLHEDVDPFEFIQLDVPLMPSALFAVNRIGSAYDGILTAVQFFIDQDKEEELTEESYEQCKFTEFRNRKCRSHLFFEEGNEC